jgi:hypothetical protein
LFKEMMMKRWLIVVAVSMLGLEAQAVTSCLQMADQRGLTGAARAQFLEACEAQARSACEAAAKKQKLAGTERENFLVRCKNESIGVR